jgi:hypothetical protein
MVRRVGDQHQMRQQTSPGHGVRQRRQPRVVEVAGNVGVDHRERFGAQQRQGVGDAAGGLQRLAFGRVTDGRAKALAVAQRRLDEMAEVGVIDDDVADPGPHQRLEMPGDQRLAPGHQQRLGRGIGQRPHAFAPSGGENHGAHQKVYPISGLRFSSSSSRRASGASGA